MKPIVIMLLIFIFTLLPVNASSISLNCDNAPVSAVLKTLFASNGSNYILNQSITGAITVSLHNVDFDTAIKTVLSSCNPQLDMTLIDGVYNIAPKNITPVITPVIILTPIVDTQIQPQISLNSFEVIKLNYADANLLLPIFGGGIVVPATTQVNENR